jgi:hypothetical protein
MNKKIESDYIMLSMMRALWGIVTPTLRAVCVSHKENILFAYFYYDGEISEHDRELAEDTMGEFTSDFSRDEHGRRIEFVYDIIRCDYPSIMPLKGKWVYYRYES